VSGGGPAFIKLGRAVVYDTRDLDAWLASGRRPSMSVPPGVLPPRDTAPPPTSSFR
jgi:hypothetical protein